MTVLNFITGVGLMKFYSSKIVTYQALVVHLEVVNLVSRAIMPWMQNRLPVNSLLLMLLSFQILHLSFMLGAVYLRATLIL